MSGLRPVFKLNPEVRAQWNKAVHELASVAGKDDREGLQKLARLSARRFVRNIADITPPSQGKADSQSKARGEAAILSDLLKLAIPVTMEGVSRKKAREILSTAAELMELHQQTRNDKGRVNPRNRKEKLFLDQREFNSAVKQLQVKVGWLAAGLNAAAKALGARLPSWITRHGDRFGSITIKATNVGIAIRIVQAVPYADHVENYERQWNFALRKEVSSLQNQAKAIVLSRAKKAGFRIK